LPMHIYMPPSGRAGGSSGAQTSARPHPLGARILRGMLAFICRGPRALCLAGTGLSLLSTACGRSTPPDTQPGNSRFHTDVRPALVETAQRLAGSITLDSVVQLGSSEDPASIMADAPFRACSVGRLGSGRFVVSAIVGGGQLAVYSRHGRFSRDIGGPGAGPREFGSHLRVLVGRGDTLYVADNSNARMVTLTSAGRVAHLFRTRRPVSDLALIGPDTILVHSRPPGASEGDTRLFELLDPSGDTLASFGEPSSRLGPLDQWILAPDQQGGFWAAGLWRYALYHWSDDRVVTRVLIRRADWFPTTQDLSPKRLSGLYTLGPPPAMMNALALDNQGRLWVYALVPDAHWATADPKPTSPRFFRGQFDTIVEVLDIAGAGPPRVLARRRVDSVLGSVCGTSLAFSVVQTSAGDTRLQVLAPELNAGPGRGTGQAEGAGS